MKLTACLLLTVVAMSTIDVGAGAIVPWTLYHQPAAYNLVQPIAVLPTNHWSTFVRSNLIGGSYSYAVQDSEAVQTISSNIQPPVVAIHLPDASSGFPLVANALGPQWVVQQGAGGFTFVPAGSVPVPGVAVGQKPAGVPGGPGGPAAAPPSVDADDVVTVSDEADGDSVANVSEAAADAAVGDSAQDSDDVNAEEVAEPAQESADVQSNETENIPADYEVDDSDSESVDSA